jgi:hypothetical protein
LGVQPLEIAIAQVSKIEFDRIESGAEGSTALRGLTDFRPISRY